MSETLSDIIREAFAGVNLGNGVGLNQAQGLDDYEDAAACARYREGDEKDDWSRIPVAELNRCYSSLSFFDAEGMRFHLPAYLIADIQGTYDFGMAFCLSHSTDFDRYDRYFGLLSSAQRGAVRAFLLHILDDPNYEFDRPDILIALYGYWTDAAS